MKWFKHETDAHTNMKLQSVIDRFGMAGYGLFWFLVEIAGKDGGLDFHILSTKNWKIYAKKFSGLDEKKLNELLKYFSDQKLIDKNALKKDELYIPKLGERSDEYTDKLRRKSGLKRDNVPLEEKRVEENRIDPAGRKFVRTARDQLKEKLIVKK